MVGNIIQGLTALQDSWMNFGFGLGNVKRANQSLQLQKDIFKYQKYYDANKIGITAQDMQNNGLNPILASGVSPSSGVSQAGGVGSVPAPDMSSLVDAIGQMNSIKSNEGIAESHNQTLKDNQDSANQTAKELKEMEDKTKKEINDANNKSAEKIAEGHDQAQKDIADSNSNSQREMFDLNREDKQKVDDALTKLYEMQRLLMEAQKDAQKHKNNYNERHQSYDGPESSIPGTLNDMAFRGADIIDTLINIFKGLGK